jgi:hypothetical protein
MPWPPRSPDLTTADFFLWGNLKAKVYRRQPTNIATLKQYIKEEFNKIPQGMIMNSCCSVISRLKHCIEHNGAPIKNYLSLISKAIKLRHYLSKNLEVLFNFFHFPR